MRHTFLLSLLLLPVTTIKPMIIDAMTHHVSTHLNRIARSALKATCKILQTHIPSQNSLNKQYDLAYFKNDQLTMQQLRKKGALPTHEEVYNLFVEKNYTLAQKIWSKNAFNTIPCDVTSAYLYGVMQNNKEFINWLLQKLNPPYDGYVITKSLELANVLQRNEIKKTLTAYIETAKPTQMQSLCYGLNIVDRQSYQRQHPPLLSYDSQFCVL